VIVLPDQKIVRPVTGVPHGMGDGTEAGRRGRA
jgi:hypothetical protein